MFLLRGALLYGSEPPPATAGTCAEARLKPSVLIHPLASDGLWWLEGQEGADGPQNDPPTKAAKNSDQGQADRVKQHSCLPLTACSKKRFDCK
jgi:hypothetical protein